MMLCMTGTATSARRSQPGSLQISIVGPDFEIDEHQHDRLGLAVDVELLLAVLLLVPGGRLLREDGLAQCRAVYRSEIAKAITYVHALPMPYQSKFLRKLMPKVLGGNTVARACV